MRYILVLALVLRLVLVNQSLWLDEAIEALALMGRQGPLLSYALADYQPPLYHFLGYAITRLFGYSEIALRLPSLIAGVLTVYFVVKIGQFIGSRKTGIVAGLLAATNPLLIYYSQEGRTYALTTFFVTASFYYFIQLLKQKTRFNYILYTLFTVLFLWTSYLSWFYLLAQGVYVLWKKRYDLLGLQAAAALTLLLWLPSFIASLGVGQYTRSLSAEWGRVVGGLEWKSLPLTWVKFNIGRISFVNKSFYAAFAGLLGLLHFYVLRRVAYKKYFLLLIWMISPIVLGLMTALVLPVYSYFRVLFVLPAYLLLLSIGLSRFKSSTYTIIAICFQLLALSYFWFTPAFHKEDWRNLTQDILAQDRSSFIALPSHEQNPGLLYYGVKEANIIEPKQDVLQGTKIYYVRYAEDLFDVGRLGQANFVRSGYTMTSQKSYPGIQLDIYEKI